MKDQPLRKHLIELLRGGQAHITFDDALKDFPSDKMGIRPAGSPHSAWELLEHIRIALNDIVMFSGALEPDPLSSVRKDLPKGYEELKWPDDYWPDSPAPKEPNDWHRSARAIEEGMESFIRLLENDQRDLFAPFPWGQEQTLLREALLIADHASYHLGQIVLIRRMLEE